MIVYHIISDRGFNSWRYYVNNIPGVNVTYKNLALTPDKIRSQIAVLLSSEVSIDSAHFSSSKFSLVVQSCLLLQRRIFTDGFMRYCRV